MFLYSTSANVENLHTFDLFFSNTCYFHFTTNIKCGDSTVKISRTSCREFIHLYKWITGYKYISL